VGDKTAHRRTSTYSKINEIRDSSSEQNNLSFMILTKEKENSAFPSVCLLSFGGRYLKICTIPALRPVHDSYTTSPGGGDQRQGKVLQRNYDLRATDFIRESCWLEN